MKLPTKNTANQARIAKVSNMIQKTILALCFLVATLSGYEAQASGYYNLGAFWKPATATSTALTISDVSTNQWGNVYIGTKVGPRAERMFTVTNTGGSAATNLAAGSPAMSAPFSFLGGTFPGQKGTCLDTLAAGATCTIAVVFNPTTTGTFNDTVRVSYNVGAASGTATRSLAGTGYKVSKVAVGDNRTVFLLNDGRVYSAGMGAGGYGQLGDGSQYENKAFLVPVSGLTNMVDVKSGESYSCALHTDGTVWCWGDSGAGTLGNNSTIVSPVPVQVSFITNAVQLGLGSYTACARLATGYIVCWGDNQFHGVDSGTFSCNGSWACYSTPVTIANITSATDFGIGSGTTSATGCAVVNMGATSGVVKCWGSNDYSRMGNPVAGTPSYGVTVEGLAGVTNTITKIQALENTFYALTSTGEVYTWGTEIYSEFGTYGTSGGNYTTPVLITALGTGVSALADMSEGHTMCAIAADGSAKCWGGNVYGTVGDGTTTDRNAPTALTAISNVSMIHGRTSDTCAILRDGSVRCWGLNSSGANADGSVVTHYLPTPNVLGFPVEPVQVVAGNNHTCALMSTGQVKCWGYNQDQVGNPGASATKNPTPLLVTAITTATSLGAGYVHTCATLADSSIKCWGDNSMGQLGSDDTANHLTPVLVSTMTNALYVSSGSSSYNSCATIRTGEIKCWGSGGTYQLGDGSGLNTSVPVFVTLISNAYPTAPATGAGHSCAVLNTGDIKCWGDNVFGQLGDASSNNTRITPVTVSNVTNAVGIRMGSYQSCALLSTGAVRCWGLDNVGQLGNNGALTDMLTPTTISGGTSNIVAFAAGGHTTCYALANGTTRCTGSDSNGQLGDNAAIANKAIPAAVANITTRVTAMGLGETHGCAIYQEPSTLLVPSPAAISVNMMKCWGNDNYGTLGNDISTASKGTAVSVTNF